MVHILVIGSPSIDTLHFNNRTVESEGGAGMYTAMAAQRSGAQVSLCAPYPDPIPQRLATVRSRLVAWHGPTISPTELPRFTISHQGDKATYLDFSLGAEAEFDISMLPKDLSIYDAVHIIPLGNARKQQSFIKACRMNGAKFISAGTYFEDTKERKAEVIQNIALADVFFMNEEEAVCIYGSLKSASSACGKTLFITLGEKGTIVIQGNHQTYLKAVQAKPLDPTGAGDTFCGATLVHLVNGAHPVMAARYAMALAALEIEQPGPTALLRDDPLPDLPLDPRVSINQGQIDKIAAIIATLPEAAPFNFLGEDFPPAKHPAALNFFFTSILQQFGFWETAQGKYHQALVAPIDRKMLKGSSYLFHAFLRPLASDPAFYTAERQAKLNQDELLALFKADDGSDPMPAFPQHLNLGQQYGLDMLNLGLTPLELVSQSHLSATPLKTFFRYLDHLGGYKEDPLRKKSGLLAFCLNQRPERYLEFGIGEEVPPVIDYHALRSALRLGLVQIQDARLAEKLTERRIVDEDDEWAVRFATYRMQQTIVSTSGKSQGAVDWFFFNYMRNRCFEMSEPDCRICAADPVCAHQKKLFQPIYRTTFY